MFFKLKLELATPFYLNGRLTLDGLLSAAIFNMTGKCGEETIPDIPLAAEHGIFKGSSLFCHARYQHERFTRIMSLRTERDLSPDLFKPNRRGGSYTHIDQQRGPYKANLNSFAGIMSREVYFWGEGDAQRCVFLLENFVHGIGKRANTGAGQIIGVSFIEEDEDRSWITRTGKPARPLPVELWESLGGAADVAKAPCAVTLPYWSTPPVEAVFPSSWTA